MVRGRAIFFTVLLIVLFAVVYAATRLVNLTQIPVFTDEAIYIRWSQIGAQDANWRFISLVDGKQPLFTWVVMVLLRLVPGDPLFVGRLASVLAGAASMVGIWFLAFEFFKSKKAAFLSSFLYLISPFALVYDRMALYDSMVATFFIWNLYLAVRLARSPRLD
ncbi:MAG: glycosyltransferase family 39 protein, partial [Patescibacteria group bacterium]